MEASTPYNQDDNAFIELSFTLPKGHRLNQPRSRSDYACPKTCSNVKPDGLEMHGFRSRAAEVLNQFKGIAWLLREMPNTSTGELELRIAVKGKYAKTVRERIRRDLVAFQANRTEKQIISHRL